MAQRTVLDNIEYLITVDGDNRIYKNAAIAIEEKKIVEIAQAILTAADLLK